MMPDTAFDEYGRLIIPLNANLFKEDGSHPEEWKGHFVIVMNDKVLVKNEDGTSKPVQFHAAIIRHSKFEQIGRTSFGYRESFNPTIFKDYEAAKNALTAYSSYIRDHWEFLVDSGPDDIFLKRRGRFFGENDVVDPLFEILDAFDYRIKTSTMMKGHKNRVGVKKKQKPNPPSDVRVHFDADAWIAQQRKRDEAKAKADSWKNASVTLQSRSIPAKLSQWERPQKNETFEKKTKMRFFAKDSKSGKFLKVTKETGLRGATLVDLDDATYFNRFDVLLEVMAAIEKSFWNSEFQSWHLVSTSAVFENGKLVNMRSL